MRYIDFRIPGIYDFEKHHLVNRRTAMKTMEYMWIYTPMEWIKDTIIHWTEEDEFAPIEPIKAFHPLAG